MPQDRLFDIWFALRVGIASQGVFRLCWIPYESTYQLFNADAAELEQLPCGERLRTALGDKSLDEAYRIKKLLRKGRRPPPVLAGRRVPCQPADTA
ncbi:MAG: hypothetical protein L6V84_01030 [Oscillospiraceae bacterium]|nr:MAG: hypothetical protein L6V84_01030 [Oscillospiraceae bacterium]